MMRLPVSPAFDRNNLAITLQTSDFFAPYASVTMLSIIENASPEYNYDLLVMTWDMREETAEKLVSMADGKSNISIRVVDVSEEIRPYQKIAKKREDYDRFSCAGVVRLIMPELLNNYDIVLNFDCDMLICADVAELFQYDLTEYYMGGVPDLLCYIASHLPTETYFTEDYVHNDLKLSSMAEYCNGGLFVLNLKNIRKDFSEKNIINAAMIQGTFRRLYEQDTFNSLFRMKKIFLPAEWNWFVDADHVLDIGIKYFPVQDSIIENWRLAEKYVKIYHFLTAQKPWNCTATQYEDKWWASVWKSPLRDIILARATENQLAVGSKKLLFICESPYQLLNILSIKYHYYPDATADLIITKSTNLSRYREKLESSGMFQKIILSNFDSKVDLKKIREISIKKRTLFPEKYEHALELEARYTDYFLPVLKHPYYQMIYYQLVKKGCQPSVFIFEDGATSYTDNSEARMEIDHHLYPLNKQFTNNISALFLYRPDCYCGNLEVPKIPIPQILGEETGFVDLIRFIFGDCQIPSARYLFFNECFARDGQVSTDIQILDSIAELVGKENIAVKLHPRSGGDEKIYQLHGYQIFSENDSPWEISVLSPKFKDKILMSVSSNTIYTPLFVSNVHIYAISLLNVMKLPSRPHAKTWEFHTFINKVQQIMDRECNDFYRPNTMSELKNIIQFIEGEA